MKVELTDNDDWMKGKKNKESNEDKQLSGMDNYFSLDVIGIYWFE